MDARASSDLSFIGKWNISFLIMWPLYNQSYCNISMVCESIDRTRFSIWSTTALHWKCPSVNAFIPQWNLKRMHSILIIIFKSHQNLMLKYDWLWSGHMIIKEMFHIPMKLKSELARASTTTTDVNNQWRSKQPQNQISKFRKETQDRRISLGKDQYTMNTVSRYEIILLLFFIFKNWMQIQLY
jgi:hypothetical protein